MAQVQANGRAGRISDEAGKVPAGTQHGRTFRIRGKGGGGDGVKGDLLVTATVVVPQKLSREAREALERFAEAVPESPRDHLIQPTSEGR